MQSADDPSRRFRGHLRIECRADAAGRTFLAKQSFCAPVHLSKPYWDGNHLIVNAVNPTAGLFPGDHVEMDVRVGPGASVVLTSPSSTRVFRARDSTGKTQIAQSFVVEGGGRLEVFPEILIPHAGARYEQKTRIAVEPGGELFFVEMIAPGRTASGETFGYDWLEFGMDLICAGRLAVRECYRLTSRTESIRVVRKRFPGAYFVSAYLVSNNPPDEGFQRALSGLSTSCVLAGVSRPVGNVSAIKLVAKDSMSLRAAVAGVRTIVYSLLGWPEPVLRKL